MHFRITQAYFVWLILCIGCFSYSFAQNARIQELETLLPEVKSDSAIIDLWNELSYEYYPVDISKTIFYSEKALQKAEEINYQAGIAQALNYRAIGYGVSNDHQNSLELNKQALTMARKLGDRLLIGKALNDLGVTYTALNLRQQALEVHLEAISYLEGALHPVQLYNLENLSYIYWTMGEEEQVEFYHSQTEALAPDIPDHLTEYYPDFYRAFDYEENEVLDSALYFYQLALDKTTTPVHGSFIHQCLAYVYSLEEQYDSAKHHSLQAIQYLEESGNIDRMLSGVNYYCDILQKNKEYQYSLDVLNGYLNGSLADHGNYLDLEFSYQLEAEAYKALRQYENANASLAKQMAIKDSLRQQEQADVLTALETQFELEKQAEENRGLKAEQAQAANMIEQRTRANIFMGLALFLLLAILGLFYRNYRTSRQFNSRLQEEINAKTAKLLAANNELKLSNAELERFAYITSHDLREPLRNISGFSTLISRRVNGEVSPMIQEYLDFIRNNTIQMDELIREILEYSRLENIQTIAQLKSVADIVDDVRQSMLVMLQERNAEITTENLPVIKTYPQYVFLVLKNLVENAVKYNQSGRPTVRIWHQKKEGNHFFYVADNGIGIDQEFKEQIFELFNRLHSRQDYEGTGIGLATCKKILTKLKGDIWLDQSSASGSVFCFFLPDLNKGVLSEDPAEMIGIAS